MKKLIITAFFVLGITRQGICANISKNNKPSVDECLKELDAAGDDWEKRGVIRKKCYLIAEEIFQENNSNENLWILVKNAEKYAFVDKRGLKAFYSEFTEKYFSSFSLEGLERADLEYLFQSYQKLAFFLPKEEIVKRSEELFYKIKSFRATTPEEEEELLNTLVMMGSWEKVERFQREISKELLDPMTLSSLKLLKNQEHQSGPKFYELAEKGELSVKNYNPRKEFSVIILVSPNCGFSNWAISEIEEDKELLDFFKEYGTFVSSRNGFLEFPEMVKWNFEHKSIPFKVVYDEEEWPSQIVWDGTPTFVFFKGNEYSHTIDYWDKDVIKKSIEWLKEGEGEFKF